MNHSFDLSLAFERRPVTEGLENSRRLRCIRGPVMRRPDTVKRRPTAQIPRSVSGVFASFMRVCVRHDSWGCKEKPYEAQPVVVS